ncbi:nucleoside diphosphate kinase B isoform X1 [Sinocyclocheilus rhinocerous]|uniref:nucleoside diphosphate kinase B isoform X1 n=1 Tax=Sinocyclocheilus rhinocerous TaxID=307959 RepID=UPI0007B849C6|nr:PREDICTED: nucleoside diphosphate kinase B isoform X1 [Sinocyclocheilus rhinocerous]
MAAKTERTFIAIKPDGVQRGLIGDIVKRFEQKGFRLVAMKFLQASEDLLKQHYIDLKDRPFYPGLVKYMSSGPVAAMVWEGLNVVKTGRVMLGETNPADSKPGTIRGDFCIEVGRLVLYRSVHDKVIPGITVAFQILLHFIPGAGLTLTNQTSGTGQNATLTNQEKRRNIIHGSDSVDSANKEISLWFKPEELVAYKSCAQDWIYE